MWSVAHSIKVKAPISLVWDNWQDVENWNVWDPSVRESKLIGSFSKGSEGLIKPMKGPPIKWTITEISSPVLFTVLSRLPLTTIEFVHKAEETHDGFVLITHAAHIKGLLAPLLKLVMRKDLLKDIPTGLTNLKVKIERK